MDTSYRERERDRERETETEKDVSKTLPKQSTMRGCEREVGREKTRMRERGRILQTKITQRKVAIFR